MMWSPTHVQLTVQRARHLLSKGKSGLNDSYVIIQNGKEKFQTSIAEQSTDPVWHEECDLVIHDKETDVVKLTIFHRNLFGLADEFLGLTLITLKEIDIYERPKNRWYTLESKTNKKPEKARGEIEVRVAFLVKSCNDKYKKKTNIHNSLLDIRSALKSDLNRSQTEKSESKLSERKFSMSAYNKIPKLASRTLSFKLDTSNSKRKFFAEKNPTKDKCINIDNIEKANKYKRNHSDEKIENDSTDAINTNTSQVTENDSSLKNELIIAEKTGGMSNKNLNNSKSNIQIEEKTEKINESEIYSDSSRTKSSLAELKSAEPLKRALSSNDVLQSSHTTTEWPKANRNRSSTLTSALSLSEKLSRFHARELVLFKNSQNDINKSLLLPKNYNISRQLSSKDSLISTRLKALKKHERRYTIDINDAIPNFLKYKLEVEKRENQTSPDSLYSSSESLLTKKSLKSDFNQKYESLNKEELIQLIQTQQLTVYQLNEQINDLEQYIDNLLVRVIEISPKILQKSNRFKK